MPLIENPILNSPFREPTRHFKFDDDGITNEILAGRRPSSPLRADSAREEERQAAPVRHRMDEGPDRAEPRRRSHPAARRRWRQGGYVGVTGVTSRLLAYWTTESGTSPCSSARSKPLETAIYITEVAREVRRRLDRERSARRPTTRRTPASRDGAQDGDRIAARPS